MSVDTAVTDDVTDVQHSRATVRPDKAETVAELTDAFRGSAAAVLTEYRGLTVKQISALRTALGADTSYAVVKNTLTKIAAGEAGLEGVDALLSGPTAVAFIKGEPVEAAKALRDFARTNPALVVKGGVMDGKALTADEVRRLADLESREVLLAKMAGALLASLSGAVRLFNEPLAQAARLAGALKDKATEDPSVLRGGAGTAPAPSDTVPADSVPADSVPADSVPADSAPVDPAPEQAAAEDPATQATGEPPVTADGAADVVAADTAGTSDPTSQTPA